MTFRKIPVVTRTTMGQILAVLDDDRYDLVVTGSHGRTDASLAHSR